MVRYSLGWERYSAIGTSYEPGDCFTRTWHKLNLKTTNKKKCWTLKFRKASKAKKEKRKTISPKIGKTSNRKKNSTNEETFCRCRKWGHQLEVCIEKTSPESLSVFAFPCSLLKSPHCIYPQCSLVPTICLFRVIPIHFHFHLLFSSWLQRFLSFFFLHSY